MAAPVRRCSEAVPVAHQAGWPRKSTFTSAERRSATINRMPLPRSNFRQAWACLAAQRRVVEGEPHAGDGVGLGRVRHRVAGQAQQGAGGVAAFVQVARQQRPAAEMRGGQQHALAGRQGGIQVLQALDLAPVGDRQAVPSAAARTARRNRAPSARTRRARWPAAGRPTACRHTPGAGCGAPGGASRRRTDASPRPSAGTSGAAPPDSAWRGSRPPATENSSRCTARTNGFTRRSPGLATGGPTGPGRGGETVQ